MNVTLWQTLRTLALALLVSTHASASRAHELNPAVADVTVSPAQVQLVVTLTAEAMLAGIDRTQNIDTDDLPEGDAYTRYREMPAEEMLQALYDAWPELRQDFNVLAGEVPVELEISNAEVLEEMPLSLPRDTRLTLLGDLPEGDAPVTVGWKAGFGPLVLRQTGGGEDAYSDFLNPGAQSQPLPRTGEIVTEGWLPLFGRYIVVGFEHIIPKGLDHILFVLGLFFFSLRVGPLLWQITAFTLAHTITLALASLKIVFIPASIVEPLIAASIVYVAVENIFGGRLGWWRIVVVTCFGLLHGLGFAFVLGDVGLEPSRFVTGLIGFNIGVEIGQLTVIAIAFLTVGYWFGNKPWYRKAIAIPASLAIAAVAAYWVVERTLL
ncbi:HupE/UreJ family protein [Oceanicola sp. 502str15]|uniref:HupE/UreJ family protein n=1 Tax=Oceanicola sp. 502str15 TaxID=2696061 RepID=UPI0020960FED|nr:HupE/UreJ family protein [Oceanicola sp. 502str15]MCO6384278.1 HupE/UreJ family protein [Oceanicola sp. 502str15]